MACAARGGSARRRPGRPGRVPARRRRRTAGRGRPRTQRVQGGTRPAGDSARPGTQLDREAVMTAVGTPVTRVDGPAKVAGAARYSAEISLPGMTHLAMVGATIARGRVTAIDTSAARAADGVLAVLTSDDLPRVAADPHLLPSLVGGPAPGESFFPMQDDEVHYAGQPVALVVAEEHEQAQHAASLVRVSYSCSPPVASIDGGRDQAYEAERLFGGLLPARNE